MNPKVALDLETTGLDEHFHGVWEIGVIRREHGIDDEHLWQIRPTGEFNEDALRICRFRERFVVPDGCDAVYMHKDGAHSKLTMGEFLLDFQDVVNSGRPHLIGAVPSFDDRFLRALLARHHRRVGWHHRLIDVESMTMARFGWPEPRGLRASAEALGIDVPADGRHTALGDARTALRIYDAITDVGSDAT